MFCYAKADWAKLAGFGRFKSRILHGSTNPDYGGSGLAITDLDRDGDIDIVYTNGDGFDYATPGSRPWRIR